MDACRPAPAIDPDELLPIIPHGILCFSEGAWEGVGSEPPGAPSAIIAIQRHTIESLRAAQKLSKKRKHWMRNPAMNAARTVMIAVGSLRRERKFSDDPREA